MRLWARRANPKGGSGGGGPATPVLSLAVDAANGPTAGTGGVTCDNVGDGTLSCVTLLTADATPTGVEIEAGQKSGGAAAEHAGSQAISGTGAQTLAGAAKPTLLAPVTGYKIAYVQRSAASVLSNVIVADGFTTTAIVAGTVNGGGASTTNPTAATGSVTVAVGDAILAVCCEQAGAGTLTAVNDNLGNSYAETQAEFVGGGVSAGHAFISIATVAGVLSSVNFAMTASSNDVAVKAAVFNGPFDALDANPANKGDNARSWTATATGTRAQASELVVGWAGVTSAGGTVVANGGFTLAGSPSVGGARTVAINYLNVQDTTSVIPSFTGDADTTCVLGSMSFARDA